MTMMDEPMCYEIEWGSRLVQIMKPAQLPGCHCPWTYPGLPEHDGRDILSCRCNIQIHGVPITGYPFLKQETYSSREIVKPRTTLPHKSCAGRGKAFYETAYCIWQPK